MLKIHVKQFYDWTAKIKKEEEDGVAIVQSKKSRSTGGNKSCVFEHTDKILCFIFTNRENGIKISRPFIARYVCSFDNFFAAKTPNAQSRVLKRFLTKHEFSYRAGTHVSQKHPAIMQDEALA